MRRERGYSALEIIGMLVAAALLVTAIAGVVYAVTSYIEQRDAAIKKSGKDECDAAYKARDNEALAAARAEIIRLNKAYRDLEQASAKRINDLADELKKERARDKDAGDRLLGDLDSGALVLREGVIQTVACPSAVGTAGAGPAAAAGAGGSGGRTCYRLAPGVEKSLVGIAVKGNAYGKRLTTCLAIAEEDRKTINAGIP